MDVLDAKRRRREPYALCCGFNNACATLTPCKNNVRSTRFSASHITHTTHIPGPRQDRTPFPIYLEIISYLFATSHMFLSQFGARVPACLRACYQQVRLRIARPSFGRALSYLSLSQVSDAERCPYLPTKHAMLTVTNHTQRNPYLSDTRSSIVIEIALRLFLGLPPTCD
ncbi:hypothetical protein ACGC1H_005259 [Rhizoctonia solani]